MDAPRFGSSTFQCGVLACGACMVVCSLPFYYYYFANRNECIVRARERTRARIGHMGIELSWAGSSRDTSAFRVFFVCESMSRCAPQRLCLFIVRASSSFFFREEKCGANFKRKYHERWRSDGRKSRSTLSALPFDDI